MLSFYSIRPSKYNSAKEIFFGSFVTIKSIMSRISGRLQLIQSMTFRALMLLDSITNVTNASLSIFFLIKADCVEIIKRMFECVHLFTAQSSGFSEAMIEWRFAVLFAISIYVIKWGDFSRHRNRS